MDIIQVLIDGLMWVAPFAALALGAVFTGSPTVSTEKDAQTNGEFLHALSMGQPIRFAEFNYTHTAAAGAGTGEIDLITLPEGKIKILPDLSRIVTGAAFVVNSDLHLGYRAYTDGNGDAVVADDNAFLDNADAGGGALDSAWVLPADGVSDHNTQSGLEIYAMVDTANISVGSTISGWVAFVTVG